MANIEDLDDDFILCNVCNNEYDESHRAPKLLPCLHTLCNDCTLNSMHSSTLTCAICQEGHTVASDLEFMKDNTMRNMMDMIRIQRKPSSIMCSADCPDGNTGDTFCKDCYVFLCRECTSAHKRTQITRRHVILSIGELQSSGIASFGRKEKCSLQGHEDQPFSFYCDNQECQKPVCTLCAVEDHSQSNGHMIKNLNEVYDENKHMLERLLGELLQKISGVSSDAKMLEAESAGIEERLLDNQTQIDALFNTFEELLRQRKEKLKERVDVIGQQRKAEISKRLESLQKCKTDMENSCNYSSRMLVFTNKPEFLQLKDTVLAKVNNLLDRDCKLMNVESIELSFNAGVDQSRFEDFIQDIGMVNTNMYDDDIDSKTSSLSSGDHLNGSLGSDGPFKMPYKGPPVNPPGTYTTNKYSFTKPVTPNKYGASKLESPSKYGAPKTESLSKYGAPKVEPLKLDGLQEKSFRKTFNHEQKSSPSTASPVKSPPTQDNVLGRPLSLKSPVISTKKQPTSLGEFLSELQTKSKMFLKDNDESQEGLNQEPERQLPKTPTTPSTLSASKRSPATPPYNPYQSPSPKHVPPSPVFGGFQAAMRSQNAVNGGVSSPGISSTTSPGLNSSSYIQNSNQSKSNRVTFGSPRYIQSTKIANNSPTNGSLDKSPVNTPTSGADTGFTSGSSPRKDTNDKATTPVLTASSYPDVKPSLSSPRKSSSDKPVVFGDITCPDFQMDPNSAHHEREVANDGRTLRNKKTDIYASNEIDLDNNLVQYKGAIGTIPFQESGKFYYEVDVVYNIQQPLEETWLVFEMGLCRLDDVDMHHTVERHEHARSFYVARYPEDGKLTQEFWHNRDLLNFIPLSDNTPGLEVRVTYGFMVDTRRKKWIIADCNNNKVLHSFDMLDFTQALYPVFGCYNPDLITVEMTLRTGIDITLVPQCLTKPGYRTP